MVEQWCLSVAMVTLLMDRSEKLRKKSFFLILNHKKEMKYRQSPIVKHNLIYCAAEWGASASKHKLWTSKCVVAVSPVEGGGVLCNAPLWFIVCSTVEIKITVSVKVNFMWRLWLSETYNLSQYHLWYIWETPLWRIKWFWSHHLSTDV